jgi:reticulon-1
MNNIFVAAADILLWRNKKCTGIALGAGTALWVFFELMQYNLITLVCHLLILSLAALFLWSNASVFIHK